MPVISWGADVSSEKLRRCARCTARGHKGGTTQQPEWAVSTSASGRFRLTGCNAIWASTEERPSCRENIPAPVFRRSDFRRRIKPATSVEVVAVVFN